MDSTKLCIDCQYVGTNSSKDTDKYRCFAPENKAGVDLVDGSTVYVNTTCRVARAHNCGTEGRWWKLKEAQVAPKPPEVNQLVALGL